MNIKKFELRLPADLHRWLRQYALDEGTSANATILAALAQYRAQVQQGEE